MADSTVVAEAQSRSGGSRSTRALSPEGHHAALRLCTLAAMLAACRGAGRMWLHVVMCLPPACRGSKSQWCRQSRPPWEQACRQSGAARAPIATRLPEQLSASSNHKHPKAPKITHKQEWKGSVENPRGCAAPACEAHPSAPHGPRLPFASATAAVLWMLADVHNVM